MISDITVEADEVLVVRVRGSDRVVVVSASAVLAADWRGKLAVLGRVAGAGPGGIAKNELSNTEIEHLRELRKCGLVHRTQLRGQQRWWLAGAYLPDVVNGVTSWKWPAETKKNPA